MTLALLLTSTLVSTAPATPMSSSAPTAAVRVFAEQALLRAPGTLDAVGHLDEAAVTLGAWHNDHVIAVAYRGAAFDVDAVVDLDDAGTRLSASVGAPTLLADTGPWTVVMTPEASVAVGGPSRSEGPGASGAIVVLPLSPKDVAFRSATLSNATGAAPTLVDDVIDWTETSTCQPKRLYASAKASAPTMATPMFLGRLTAQEAPPKKGFARAAFEVSGFVIVGYARADEVDCGDGGAGGLGLRGTGGASDGFIMAKEAKLPAGARFFATGPADKSLPIATFHRPVTALLVDDGSWRVPNLCVDGVTLGLHSGRIDPVPADAAFVDKSMRTHGVGNAFSLREDWPRLPRNKKAKTTKK